MRKNILPIVLLVAAAGALFFYLGRESNRVPPPSPQEESELREGQVIGRVIVTELARKAELRVAQLSGNAKTTVKNEGRIRDRSFVDTIMRADTPFTVDYFVDLSEIGLNDYNWNQEANTLTVNSPQPYPAPPNLDESRRKVEIDGLWVARRVGTELSTETSRQGQKLATGSAQDPRNLGRAQQFARQQIAEVVGLPLQKALGRNVNVNVRFAGEPSIGSEQMDVGPSICAVLNLPEEKCAHLESAK